MPSESSAVLESSVAVAAPRLNLTSTVIYSSDFLHSRRENSAAILYPQNH
jgi:hypothetical protein